MIEKQITTKKELETVKINQSIKGKSIVEIKINVEAMNIILNDIQEPYSLSPNVVALSILGPQEENESGQFPGSILF